MIIPLIIILISASVLSIIRAFSPFEQFTFSTSLVEFVVLSQSFMIYTVESTGLKRFFGGWYYHRIFDDLSHFSAFIKPK